MTPTFYFVTSEIPKDLIGMLQTDRADDAFREAVVAEHSHRWGSHEWVWIVQTFLHMKQAGLNVKLVDRPVADSICITHFVATKNKVWPSNCFIVGIRSDNSPLYTKEFEVVQSPAILSDKNACFINHWPQTHVFPRNSSRGDRVENISYFGGVGGLSSAFYDEKFKASLQALGVSLNLCFDTKLWGDYRDTDLVVAVRNHHHRLLINTKPASKLINAWQAGCVALLGKEPAYQAAGRSGRDYFEVETPEDVLSLVRKLKDSPDVYRRVRESGIQKYSDYSFDAIAQQWVNLLTGPVTDAFVEWQNASWQRKALRHSQRYRQSACQWLAHKLFYLPIRSQEFVGKTIYKQFGN